MSGYLYQRSVPFSFFLHGHATGPHPANIPPHWGQQIRVQCPYRQSFLTGSAHSAMFWQRQFLQSFHFTGAAVLSDVGVEGRYLYPCISGIRPGGC